MMYTPDSSEGSSFQSEQSLSGMRVTRSLHACLCQSLSLPPLPMNRAQVDLYHRFTLELASTDPEIYQALESATLDNRFPMYRSPSPQYCPLSMPLEDAKLLANSKLGMLDAFVSEWKAKTQQLKRDTNQHISALAKQYAYILVQNVKLFNQEYPDKNIPEPSGYNYDSLQESDPSDEDECCNARSGRRIGKRRRLRHRGSVKHHRRNNDTEETSAATSKAVQTYSGPKDSGKDSHKRLSDAALEAFLDLFEMQTDLWISYISGMGELDRKKSWPGREAEAISTTYHQLPKTYEVSPDDADELRETRSILHELHAQLCDPEWIERVNEIQSSWSNAYQASTDKVMEIIGSLSRDLKEMGERMFRSTTFGYFSSSVPYSQAEITMAYRDLELPQDASLQEINRQYRKLARQYHPDKVYIHHDDQNYQPTQADRDRWDRILSAFTKLSAHKKAS
ncbi:DnaJ domain-containing protein [Parendozoicomonas haliclonae]|uniref:Dna-J like membrane chaperone protein n=2 Tax=Parendozoicomonas haliclonae TaxID=1960125 RepID=A0A1X7AGG1_9GAMM|nr:Dna-J like membrane chaperone protein [Parendozoicomonas haliclonae]